MNFNNLKKLVVLVSFIASTSGANAGLFEDFFAAAKVDDESTIVGLTLRGFDLNSVNEKGETALLIAVREGSDKVANFLLEQPSVNVEARNAQGESPLMLAAIKGRLDLAKRLIERKAEVNKPGWTPLHYAASNTEPVARDMVQLLLDHYAYIDAESPNRSTPLMMVARYGHSSVVGLLLEEGADPTLRNDLGMTAIDFARQIGRDETADLIAKAIRSKQSLGHW